MTNAPQPNETAGCYPTDDYLSEADFEKLLNDQAITSYLGAIERANGFDGEELADLPDAVHDGVLNYVDVGIQAQADILAQLTQDGYDSAQVLRAAAVERKKANPAFAGRRVDERFIDEDVFRLNRGLVVELLVEVPKDGVSRHQAAFFERLMPDAAAGNVIAASFAAQELLAMTLPEGEEYAADNARHAKGMLLSAALEEEGSPLLLGPMETEMALLSALPSDYEYEYVQGTVESTPGESNGGRLTLADGRSIESCNVRIAMVVGADPDALLDRGEKEIYFGRRVRVWHQGSEGWVKGRIVNPDSWNGLIEIEADEVVHENVKNMGGKGFTVHRNSPDIDFRDPETTEEAVHLLEVYKHIRTDTIVRFTDPNSGESMLGSINGIDSENQRYLVGLASGHDQVFAFDDARVQVVDAGTVAVEVDDRTVAMRGARFALPGAYDGDKQAVFEIMGVDTENQLVFARQRSHREYWQSYAQEIPLYLLESIQSPAQIAASCEMFPALATESAYSLNVRFVHDGQILEGALHEDKTAPFYFEVIIAKTPEQLAAERAIGGRPKFMDVDQFHRYDVLPDDVIEIAKRPKR